MKRGRSKKKKKRISPDFSKALLKFGSGGFQEGAECYVDDYQPNLLMCGWNKMPVDIGVNPLNFQLNVRNNKRDAWEVIIGDPDHKLANYLGTRKYRKLSGSHPFITHYRVEAGALEGGAVEFGRFADGSQTIRIQTKAFAKSPGTL